MTMDLAAVWQEVALFRAQALATTGAIHGDAQEFALVTSFLSKVPIAAVFACLQDASDREDAKQVRGALGFPKGLDTSCSGLTRRVTDNTQVKDACSCIDRVLSARSDGASLFFQPEVSHDRVVFFSGLVNNS
jgi:hypothetical protein